MSVVYSHFVRSHEVDDLGLLPDCRFLELAETGFIELFGSLGYGREVMASTGLCPSVIEHQMDFRVPTSVGDRLDMEMFVAEVDMTSFRLSSRLSCGSKLVATVESKYINLGCESGGPQPLPKEIIRVLVGALHERSVAIE